MDDFWSNVANHPAVKFLRDSYTQNKDSIHKWLGTAVSAINPMAGKIT